MSAVPRKYRFDNPMPSFEPRPLPAQRPAEGYSLASAPGGDQQVWQPQPQPVQVVHIHEAAPPDRTLQRLALGAGVGGGAVAAGVYFGPLLVASLTTMAVIVLAGGLVISVLAVAIVHVIGALKPDQPKGRRRR